MKKTIVILLGMSALLSACEKEEEIKYSGIAIFTSEPRGEYFTSGYGFSFDEGKNIVCSDLNCTGADIVAIHLIMQTEIDSVFLQSPDNLEAFHLNASFDTEAEAIAYYEDYNEVTTNLFRFDTGNLEKNQVWTFQSLDKKYAKFRIMEVFIYNEATYPYAEVKVEYKYQPGGSKTFSR